MRCQKTESSSFAKFVTASCLTLTVALCVLSATGCATLEDRAVAIAEALKKWSDSQSDAEDVPTPTVPDVPDVEEPEPQPVPEGFPAELNTNGRDGDPRKLAETIQAELQISGRNLYIRTTDDRKWRTVNTEGGVNANIWVMAERNGKWFATTWEWMRPGAWSKPWNKCRPDHAKSSVMPSDFRLQNGDYIFASTIVRHPRIKNGKERTNIMQVTGL